MANAITYCRILLSILLLFLRPLSPCFLLVYLLAGLTDMLDGTAARRTHTESAFGARLDTAADLCFAAAAAYKLLPIAAFPPWVWGWAVGIAAIKVVNIISGLVLSGRFPAVHSPANKAAGLLLFLLPLSLPFLPAAYSAVPVCALATFAAVQEGRLIRTGPSAEGRKKEK